ncbi:MAG: hypothetical protein QXP68_02495 [Thermosphaera sp.]
MVATESEVVEWIRDFLKNRVAGKKVVEKRISERDLTGGLHEFVLFRIFGDDEVLLVKIGEDSLKLTYSTATLKSDRVDELESRGFLVEKEGDYYKAHIKLSISELKQEYVNVLLASCIG